MNVEEREIVIKNIDCPDCAVKLEKMLLQLPGVKEAKIDFSTGKLRLRSVGSMGRVMKTLESAGYTVDQGRVRRGHFRLSGLDCPDCARRLKDQLKNVPGVWNAEVNYHTGTLVITYEPDEINIVGEVSQLGYDLKEEQSKDQVKRSLPFSFRGILTAISGMTLLFAILLGAMVPGHSLLFPLFLVAIGAGGFFTVRRAFFSLRSLTLDMNVLLLVAVLGAMAIGEWMEGALVVFLFSLSNTLESYTMERTRQSIRSLMELAPREAVVSRQGQEKRVPVEEVQVGECLIIRPGDRIPLDGVVTEGQSTVNQAAITGESLAVTKGPGSHVFAGTINHEGNLEVRTTKMAHDTTLAKIIYLVEKAQKGKAPAQQFIDRFSAYYTPVVVVLAALVASIPPLLFAQPFSPWLYRGLALLVVACPCALVISTPVSIVSAIGNAARHGVLVKGGIHLEQAGTIKLVAFDKTGTLTWGRPDVIRVVPGEGISQKRLLALAAGLESRSEHPLAVGILRRARMEGVEPYSVQEWTALPGKGVKGTIKGRWYYLGNSRLFRERGISLEGMAEELDWYEEQGETLVLVGDDQKILGWIGLADTIRPGAEEAVASLRQGGVKNIAMLTGDNGGVARVLGEKTGIDLFWAQLLPQEKMELIKELKSRYGSVAMVGDGINDAPALAEATLGIAMGVAGTDSALETADIALMADDLTKLSYTIRLSRATGRVIRQNIAFSLIIKFTALLLIVPNFLTLWMAVLADTGAALVVTLNGMGLNRVRP